MGIGFKYPPPGATISGVNPVSGRGVAESKKQKTIVFIIYELLNSYTSMKEPIPFDFPAFHFKPEWGVSIIPTPDHTVKILVTDKKQYATITKEIEKIFNQEANQ